MFFFHLLPLAMVGAGVWRSFGGGRLRAAETFNHLCLRFLSSRLCEGSRRRCGNDLFSAALTGFFVVMMCFPVGSFLLPDAPAQPPDSQWALLIAVAEKHAVCANAVACPL
jgi:hypothetical protein